MNEYESKEEYYFSLYLDELEQAGYVKHWDVHVETFELSLPEKYQWIEQLKTKTKTRISELLKGHEYTPDFWIDWNEKAEGVFYQRINSGRRLNLPFIAQDSGDCDQSIVDVKPKFDHQNMTRLFTINQKWLFQVHDIYVQKIVPTGSKTCLFASTFTPERYLLTDKTGKPRRIKWAVKGLNEYAMACKCNINGNRQ